MNAYDSQMAAGILEKAGFQVIAEPEDAAVWKNLARHLSPSALNAGREVPDESLRPDIVLMNTCSVRDHAEERVWGRLGMLGKEKKENPDLIIGLMGCMVEEHRERLFKRFPYLDLMVGTRNIKELPEILREIRETRRQVARIKQEGLSIEYSKTTKPDSRFHAWLPIMTGCDKCCTFCIVPKTRGSEVSMPAREVCREAARLIENGIPWITLLGQNVNSYKGGATQNAERGTQDPDVERCALSVERGMSFPKLLEMLCKIEGLKRLSFTTSHPQDATEELFQALAGNPKISRRFHLPLQSGSDRVLKRMKRLHTFAEYKAKIDRLRALVPEISITTDLIAGFSGETEEDHLATKRALDACQFDGAFIYKYSARPGTPAAQWPDDVPEEAKVRRHRELLTVQREITEGRSRALLGKTFTVFVDGRHAENPKEQAGRTDQDRRVIFESEEDLAGQFVRVEFTDLSHETFRGKRVR